MEFLKKLYHWSSTWTGTVVIVLSIIFFVAQAFVIPSGSMKNTLLIGDMLFVKKFAYGIPTPTIPWLEVKVLPDFNDNGHLIEGDRPKRGDITVFRYPGNPKNSFSFLTAKIRGLPGRIFVVVNFVSSSNFLAISFIKSYFPLLAPPLLNKISLSSNAVLKILTISSKLSFTFP